MIYKIIMDFTNLDEVIKLLSKRFNLIFVDNAIYICDKKYANTTISYIKKLLKNNNVFIRTFHGFCIDSSIWLCVV